MAFFIDKINPNATTRNGYWDLRYRRGFCVLWKRTIYHSNYQLPIRLFVRWRPTCQGHAPKDKCDLRKNRYQDWQQYSGDTRINKPNNSLKCHHHCTKYKFEVKTPTLREFSRIKNRVFHSVTVRKNNQLNNANVQHKKCSRNIYVVKFSFPKYKSVVFAA